jgi:NADH:ubiquinone reductase (H+-translocating)
VRVGEAVEDVTRAGVRIGGSHVPAATVVWAAGVVATPVARWLGVPTDRSGRVEVAADLSVPGRPGIYVIGDAALAHGDGGRPLPGLAQVAKQQGRHLGRELLRSFASDRPLGPFRFRDRGNTAIIGRNAAVFDFGRWRLVGRSAWVLWAIVHVYLLVGFDKRLLVTVQWLWRYVTHRRGARLIVGQDAPADLWPASERRQP